MLLSQHSAEVTHHVGIPSALVIFLHLADILMKALAHLVADLAKIRGKQVQVRIEEVDFEQHTCPQLLKCGKQLLYNLAIVVRFLVSLEVGPQ